MRCRSGKVRWGTKKKQNTYRIVEEAQDGGPFTRRSGLGPDHLHQPRRCRTGRCCAKFMTKLLNHPQVDPLMSDEHFSVDGTLIEAWASHKSSAPRTAAATKTAEPSSTASSAEERHACQHERSRQPSLPQGCRAGGEALLHGPRHDGEPAWAGGGRHRHVRHRHCGSAASVLALFSDNKSPKWKKGQCSLVCRCLAEFVLAQLSGAHDARRATS